MSIAHSPHAPVSARRPEPWGICDRCGFRWLLRRLPWQYDWRGMQMQNLRIRVCPRCLDVPNDQLRPLVIGPDPVPVRDPRPGNYATQMGFTPTFSIVDLLEDNPFEPNTTFLTDTAHIPLDDTDGSNLTDG
jgi:hypothetical protein